MKIKVACLFGHGLWEDYCACTGMNPDAVKDGLVSESEYLPISAHVLGSLTGWDLQEP